MNQIYIGIDLSKEYFDIVLLAQGQMEQVSHRRFANDKSGWWACLGWLHAKQVEEGWLAMEATGRYWQGVARFFYELGYHVSVVNPWRISAYRPTHLMRHKTDVLDALLIADYCRTHRPRLWQPPQIEVEALQDMERRLEELKKMRTMEKNRLQSGQKSSVVDDTIRQHIEYLEKAIQELERKMREHIEAHVGLRETAELLTTIKGIGIQTAALIIGEIKDIERFANARELTTYAGVKPRYWESGKSVRKKAHITKTGNVRLRRGLYMPTLTAMRHNPMIRAFSERLLAQGKPKKVVILAAMRKLLHIIYGVWKHGQPFDPQYEQRFAGGRVNA